MVTTLWGRKYWVGHKVPSGFSIRCYRNLKWTFWLTQYYPKCTDEKVQLLRFCSLLGSSRARIPNQPSSKVHNLSVKSCCHHELKGYGWEMLLHLEKRGLQEKREAVLWKASSETPGAWTYVQAREKDFYYFNKMSYFKVGNPLGWDVQADL